MGREPKEVKPWSGVRMQSITKSKRRGDLAGFLRKHRVEYVERYLWE